MKKSAGPIILGAAKDVHGLSSRACCGCFASLSITDWFFSYVVCLERQITELEIGVESWRKSTNESLRCALFQ